MASLPDHLMPGEVGTRRLSKEALRAHQRERVLAAAAPVFAGRGYLGTTVDDLVAAARIGVGSFYALFSSKQDCFLALYDLTVDGLRSQVEAADPGAGVSWPERYCTCLRKLLEATAADPDRARVVIVEAITAGPAGEARYSETLGEVASALAGARAIERPGDALPAYFERATAAGLAWLLHQRLASGDPLRAGELLPEMTRIVLEAYPA